MVKFAEANTRMYKNIFVCRKCKRKRRTTPLAVLNKQIICQCGCKVFRAVRRK